MSGSKWASPKCTKWKLVTKYVLMVRWPSGAGSSRYAHIMGS